MKPATFLLLALSLLFSLTACRQTAPEVTPATDTSSPSVTATSTETTGTQATETTQSAAPVYVYEAAVEDFLLPIEEFSWERQSAPEYIMLHFNSAVVAHPEDPFNMEYIRKIFIDYDVSVHYIVERDGTVRCYIPEDRVAWHAGAGEWNSDPKYTNTMNQYAIGIEIVAIGSQSDMSTYLTAAQYQALDASFKGYTQEQYQALQLLIADLCSRYNIPADRDHVIGHQEYSPKKSDPGELFDWSQVLPNP